MAGDWLKFEKATPDKPEVFAMATILGLDSDAVVGKLFRVWSWFDTHTVDGNAAGVTLALPDRVAGVTGFAEAMVKVGWLRYTEGLVSLPRFDRHTGSSAKKRAQTAVRVAVCKVSNAEGNAEGNAPCVSESDTIALPREEKRRVEKEPSVEEVAKPERESKFNAFWEAYPKKRSKGDAEKVFAKIKPSEFEKIMQALKVAKSSPDWVKEFGKYIPYPASWLNSKGWEDEHPASLAPQSGRVKPEDPERWREYLKSLPMAYVEYQFAPSWAKEEYFPWTKKAA